MSGELIARKVSRRSLIKATAAATGALVLGACAPQATPTTAPTSAPAAKPTTAPTAAPTAVPAPKEKVTVTWWHALSGSWGEFLKGYVQSFNDSQAAVTVKAESQGSYNDLRDKFAAGVAANAVPEVVAHSDMAFPAFARNGALEALDELAKGPNALDLADYFGVVDRGKINGKLYQLPLGVSTPIFYCNPDMVKSAGLSGTPKTWDDLFETYMPKTTVKDGGKTKIYGFSFLANADWWWQQSYAWMYGGKLSDDEWNTYFDSPEVIEFLTRFQKAFQAGQAYIPTSADGGAKGYFASGFAAMMVESTGVLASIDGLTKDKFKAEVGYMPEGPKGRMVPTGGNGLSISAKLPAAKRDAAWEFVRWTQQPDQIVAFDKATGYLTYTKKSSEKMADFLASNPRYKVAVDQMAWSRPQSNIQTIPRAANIYFDAMLQVFQGGKDPKTLMPEVQKQVQAILKEEGFRK